MLLVQLFARFWLPKIVSYGGGIAWFCGRERCARGRLTFWGLRAAQYGESFFLNGNLMARNATQMGEVVSDVELLLANLNVFVPINRPLVAQIRPLGGGGVRGGAGKKWMSTSFFGVFHHFLAPSPAATRRRHKKRMSTGYGLKMAILVAKWRRRGGEFAPWWLK